MEIITLLRANIRNKKGSFLCVFILTFIISICLTTIISMNYNIRERAEASLKLNDTGDLIPIISAVHCTDSMLQKIRDNKDVDHIRVMTAITQKLEINKRSNGNSTFFAPYDPKKLSYRIYSRNELSFLKSSEQLKPGEIYLPISFKRIYKCKIGDRAYLTTGSGIKTFTIKGFFEEPLVGAEMIGVKLALMNEEDFSKLYASRIKTVEEMKKNEVGIRGYYFVHIFQAKDSGLTMNELKKAINDETGIMNYTLFSFTRNQSKDYTLMFTQTLCGIMTVFLVLLFLVVLIVTGHSISTGIEMDYMNLGVLKAIGFDQGKLRTVLVLEYLLAEFTGAVVGMAGSIPAIYYLNAVFIRMTGLLSSVKPAFGICTAILTAVLMLSALFIFLKTRAITKVSPVRAISGGRDSIYFHSRLELPVEGKALYERMALRQLTSNGKQYLSSMVIVAILVYFLISITVINTGMNQKTIETSFGVEFSDMYVGYNPKDDSTQEEMTALQKEVEADIQSVVPIKKSFVLGSSYFTINGDAYHTSIYKDPTIIKSILKGRAPLYDNEVLITKIVAKELNVHMGDTVKIENLKLAKDYIICGYFQSTNDLGRTLAVSEKGAKRIMPELSMSYVDYELADSSKAAQAVRLLKDKYKDRIDTKDAGEDDFGDTIISSMAILNVIIYTISILFAFVVIVIVCSKIFLKERNDYGIYKALGFGSSALRLQFALRFAMVAFAGGLLGILLSLCFNNKMMNALLTNIGITDFPAAYTPVSLILPITVLTICFFVFAYFVSRRIKRVDTRSLISNN